jgi:hypothetical protein
MIMRCRYSSSLIGTIRPECLDHIIVFGEAHLRRRGRTKTGRLWVYTRDDRSWSGPDPPAAVYSEHAGPTIVERLVASYLRPTSADFITIIAESSFQYTQALHQGFRPLRRR